MDKFIWNRNLKIRLAGETLLNLLYWMYFPFIAVYFSQTIGLLWAGMILMVPPIPVFSVILCSVLISHGFYLKLSKVEPHV